MLDFLIFALYLHVAFGQLLRFLSELVVRLLQFPLLGLHFAGDLLQPDLRESLTLAKGPLKAITGRPSSARHKLSDPFLTHRPKPAAKGTSY